MKGSKISRSKRNLLEERNSMYMQIDWVLLGGGGDQGGQQYGKDNLHRSYYKSNLNLTNNNLDSQKDSGTTRVGVGNRLGKCYWFK